VLKELVIKDFAIIDRLELSFGPGLSCLTGETGAGKSILVDAISVLLGGKAGPEYLRDGAEASVEGSFDIAGQPELADFLEGQGYAPEGDLIIRRVFSAGRGKAYVGGSLANIQMIQEIGNFLVDLHGQHEHQSLLRVDSHMGLLDSYCSLGGRAAEYAGTYTELGALKRRLAGLEGMERERARRLDLLMFQKDEIDKVAPVPGEEDELKAERARLMHADRLRALTEASIEGLKDSDVSALSLLGEALKAAREMESLVPSQAETCKLIESAAALADEACSRLRDFGRSLDPDPARLSEVEERLDSLARLRKKYGETASEILEYREKINAELMGLEGSEAEISSLREAIKKSEAGTLELARGLTEARLSGAEGFCKKVEEELSGLGMEKARFLVQFKAQDEPGPRGMEKAEFLLSANPGETPKPLVKIASGGELSRVMLALKVILSRADDVPTLIFDEVDSGVGGRTAGALGRKLKEAASGRQVLCITHLPQVASQAKEHFLVEKEMVGGRTRVGLRRLDGEERVKEVARMLGGEGSKAASAHAAELVERGGF